MDRGILWPQHGNVWSMEPNKSLNRESLIIATELALLGRKFGEKFEVPKHEMESTCRVLVEELFRACGFSNWNTHVASRLIRGLEILSCELWMQWDWCIVLNSAELVFSWEYHILFSFIIEVSGLPPPCAYSFWEMKVGPTTGLEAVKELCCTKKVGLLSRIEREPPN